MTEDEVIIVDGIPDKEYDAIVNECIRYAIISKPFTIRRIDKQTILQAIINIFKGKIAEAIFQFFCRSNNIILDWDTCATPFWQIDKRDFILNGYEWDIKNNYLFHSLDMLGSYRYIDLPCLIPNRFNPGPKRPGDQWYTRNEIMNPSINLQGASYIFSFLKAADLQYGKRGIEFYRSCITEKQLNFIDQLEKYYKGIPVDSEPFTEKWFWQIIDSKGGSNYIQLNFRPYLIITGYANSNHWHYFKDTGPFDRDNNWRTYIRPTWYNKTYTGSCNFMNGTLWTTITNATVPASYLPSFSSIFPKLRNTIKFGRFRN